MAHPHVLVLFNEPTLAPSHPDAAAEHEVIETADFVAGSLTAAGMRTSRLGISHDPARLLDGLKALRPDVVFNLYEGTAEQGQSEGQVAGLLEWLRMPYTGCPANAIALARDKPMAKMVLKGAGLPTPRFLMIDRLPVPRWSFHWPAIVKLATEDASIGIDQGSVVTEQEPLHQRVALLLERYRQPILVEEFIEGREFNIAIIENSGLQVLPIGEIVFMPGAGVRWNIVSYAAKWLPGSAEDHATVPRCPADLTPTGAEELSRLAVQAYRLLGCRDYARVDCRVTPAGEPYILEINPNPDFHPAAGLARSLKTAAIEPSEFAAQLVRRAWERGK